MNADQIGGVVRAVVGIGTAWLLGRGYITSGTAADISTAVLAVVVAGWSAWTNKPGTVIPVAK